MSSKPLVHHRLVQWVILHLLYWLWGLIERSFWSWRGSLLCSLILPGWVHRVSCRSSDICIGRFHVLGDSSFYTEFFTSTKTTWKSCRSHHLWYRCLRQSQWFRTWLHPSLSFWIPRSQREFDLSSRTWRHLREHWEELAEYVFGQIWPSCACSCDRSAQSLFRCSSRATRSNQWCLLWSVKCYASPKLAWKYHSISTVDRSSRRRWTRRAGSWLQSCGSCLCQPAIRGASSESEALQGSDWVDSLSRPVWKSSMPSSRCSSLAHVSVDPVLKCPWTSRGSIVSNWIRCLIDARPNESPSPSRRVCLSCYLWWCWKAWCTLPHHELHGKRSCALESPLVRQGRHSPLQDQSRETHW